jgi:membrane protein implicated in regulation of membrane protease activity
VTALLVLGALGVALIVVALVFGDVLDGLLPDVSLGDSGGLFSTEVLGSFLAAFGFGAALLERSLPTPLAVGGGVAAGVVVGGATLAFSRSVMRMPTDATMRTHDLVGKTATVITRIPDNGYGEIALSYLGQRHKFNARADAPLASGANVVVVEVLSPTSVVVTEAGF